uniref:Glutathione s-transferase 3 n=1 Tax=Macrocystis pyrifera TaxID=35122 RepID=A0A9E7VG11_MACPY|nr:glutathione s-transferase 3 [Macrocystis pyrifera]
MSDSVPTKTAITTGISLAVAGLAVGLAGPKLVEKIITKMKPGGKFTGMNKPTAGARTVKELQGGDHPIQLYSMATPNGQKVTVALEEMGLKYDAWYTDIMAGDQFTSGFVEINPNSKIPALVHRDAPGGKPLHLFETGNILLYLAELTGKFLPTDPAKKAECLNWLFFNIGEAPYFGQFGHFTRYAPMKIDYAVTRYSTEVKRAMDVLDKQLERKSYLCGEECTIADIAWLPWVRCLDVFYKASETLELASFENVAAWRARMEARPATAKGLKINSDADGGVYRNYSS